MGGGGDDGASERQAKIEADKQSARDRLNLIFGEAPTTSSVNKEDFTHRSQSTPGSRSIFSKVFDQAGYDAAVAAEHASTDAQAATNKAAREALYTGVRDNAYTAGKRQIDEQNTDAQRNLKFSLFSQGLNGGSTDIDQNALVNRKYNQGLIDLGAKADGVAADMRGSDESTRLGLLQSIDQGVDSSSAISSALNQMKVNSDKAASDAAGTSVGDLFADAGLLYQQSKTAQGAYDWRNSALFPGAKSASPTASNGTVTKTY